MIHVWLFLDAILCVLAYTTYSRDHLEAFVQSLPAIEKLDKSNGPLLTPLLVPRVSGTQGATDVMEWLKTYLSRNLTGWVIEEDRFTDHTPLDEVEFVNLIATMDPPGVDESEIRRLVIAAHYDSKMTPPGFIGATDSSVPCAIMLYLAEMLSDRLPFYWETKFWDVREGELDDARPLGVQLIFFDGEEAVQDWTDDDSIYGARHLAAKWESEKMSPSASSGRTNKLESIDLLLLLDLLGSEDMHLSSFFKTTHWAYRHLAWTEELLRSMKITETRQEEHIFASDRTWFTGAGQIGDDHIPFMQRGVQILHAIQVPFPQVWHTMDDDADHLHQPTINDLAVLFAAFTAQYLDLPMDEAMVPVRGHATFPNSHRGLNDEL